MINNAIDDTPETPTQFIKLEKAPETEKTKTPEII
jgi:hypothetical protein